MSTLGNFNKIHILGASGSGTTTLAEHLAEKLLHEHFDSDDYFWELKYSHVRAREHRILSLQNDLESVDKWLLSGSVIDWGDPLIPLFDLLIFLSIPNEIRLERLKQREMDRFGSRILPGNDKHNDYRDFIAWASCYENGGLDVRSRKQQEAWLKQLSCPVLRINGDFSVEQNVKTVMDIYLS